MNTPKFKLGQWVTHDGKRKQVTLVGHSLYFDDALYQLGGGSIISQESELSPANKYIIGDWVWYLKGQCIYRAKVLKVIKTDASYLYNILRDNEVFPESSLYPTKGDLLNSLEVIDLCK